MEIKKILEHVDHTLLAQNATWAEIQQICDDAIAYHTASVCIPPSYVRQAKEYVQDQVAICTVIGFPNGYMTTAAKEFETKDALQNGADEIDMVINIGWLNAGADYIKTSTGFAGAGATFADVKLFSQHIGPNVKIKAAGGISSMADAEEFLSLGATRLGTSRIIKLVKN